VSIKERAAAMMGGHRADFAFWYDELSGNWISSKYYCQQLPEWLERFNDEGWAEQRQGWTWTPLVPELVGGTRPSPQAGMAGLVALGRTLPKGGEFYNLLGFTPLGVEYTLEGAKRAVVGENLGVDEDTDFLWISLSSIDKLGHQEGPYSPEMQDMMLRTDRDLADFFAFLQQRGVLQDTVIALSGDHGGMELPESSRMPHGRLNPDLLKEKVNAALSSVLGPGLWVIDCHPPEIWLDPRARREDALRAACQAAEAQPGVEVALNSIDIERNSVQPGMAISQVARSYNRRRSPEILVVMAPYWLSTDKKTGTSHNPVWNYDTKVPLVVRGKGIASGLYVERCTPRDLAPTLCELLKIPPPAMCSGQVLEDVLEGRR
jgi:predicted AlkP superfamily pyrophosphatase or phosphodiesterase